jgi:membrane protein
MQVGRHPGTPGYRFSLALTLLGELASARAGGQRGVGLMVLAEQLRLDPLQLEPIVEVLQQLDWVGRLDEAGAPRLVLLVDPARTQLAPLLSRLLLAPTPAVTPFWQQTGWHRMLLAEALPLASTAPSLSALHSA